MAGVIDILSLVPHSLNLRSNHLWLDYDDEADVYQPEKTAAGDRQRNRRALRLSLRRKRIGRRHCSACQVQREGRRRLGSRPVYFLQPGSILLTSNVFPKDFTAASH